MPYFPGWRSGGWLVDCLKISRAQPSSYISSFNSSSFFSTLQTSHLDLLPPPTDLSQHRPAPFTPNCSTNCSELHYRDIQKSSSSVEDHSTCLLYPTRLPLHPPQPDREICQRLRQRSLLCTIRLTKPRSSRKPNLWVQSTVSNPFLTSQRWDPLPL